jgi:hypothetical protein
MANAELLRSGYDECIRKAMLELRSEVQGLCSPSSTDFGVAA